MSYEALVEVDFLTLGHCLCANQSLVLLEEQFMTRWFSLDLRSSEERREAGNISGGRPEGATAAFCTYALHAKDLAHILTLWLALSHARTVSPLLIKDANVLHTRSLPEKTTGFNSPFLFLHRKVALDASSPAGCFAQALHAPAKQYMADFTGKNRTQL